MALKSETPDPAATGSSAKIAHLAGGLVSHTISAQPRIGEAGRFRILVEDTLFVFAIGSTVGQCIATKHLLDPAMLFFTPDRRHAEAAIVIDINRLRERAFAAVGLDARDYE